MSTEQKGFQSKFPWFVAAFALVGVLFVLTILAATENGQVTFNVSQVSGGAAAIENDNDADGGSFVSFAGSNTPPTASCSRYVSPSGNDSNSGTSQSQAWKTPDTAAQSSSAGSIICFAPGNYTSGLAIQSKNGTSSNPIIFKALDPNNRPVFSLGGYTKGGARGAVNARDSSYIEFHNLESVNSMRGMYIDSSNNILVDGCNVHNVGQEGIHAGIGGDRSGAVSSFITIRNCEVYNTGNRPGIDPDQAPITYSVFGEMIYVGTGSGIADATHDVLIENNTLRDNAPATSEAINIKSSTFNVTVRNNHIYNVNSWCEAAIRVNNSDNLKVLGNFIHNITASGLGGNGNLCTDANAIRFNSTNALIEDNIIWNVNKRGILADDGSSGTVRYNTVVNSGTNDLETRGTASFSKNVTSDGTLSSTRKSSGDYVGPTSGSANAGQGPGSGFRLKSPGDFGQRLY